MTYTSPKARSAWVTLIVVVLASLADGVAASTVYAPVDASPRLVISISDGSTGQPLIGRVRLISDAWPRTRKTLTVDGHAELSLEPGSYQVLASHGPEWSALRTHVVVSAAEQHRLNIKLQREVDASAYSGCDLHVHTSDSSDAKQSVAQQALNAAAEGLQVAVITDHNHATDVSRLTPLSGVTLVPGVEVTTWRPEFGHFNAFPLRDAPAYKHSDPERMLRALHERHAGFVQVNHPRLMQHIGYFSLGGFDDARSVVSAMAGFDGLEVWNGYDLSRAQERDAVIHDWFALLAHGQHIVATGGSDSHGRERNVVGYPRTYVQVPRAGVDQASMLQALRGGHAFISNGPLLTLSVQDAQPGDTVQLTHAQRSVHVHVKVDAPAFMDLQRAELWVDGKPRYTHAIATWPASATKSAAVARLEWSLELPVAGAHQVVAMVRGERALDELYERANVAPFALTNPVWFAHGESRVGTHRR